MTDVPPLPVPAFTPVPIKTRAGWTRAKQAMFMEALAATGSVRLATEAVGMSQTHVYKLRNAPGGESFARAWDEAVTLAARRVRDVLVEQAIHGVPERVLVGKETVVERRRFNHRTMIWVLQHHMPDDYPGGSTTHRRGWGRGWERGRDGGPAKPGTWEERHRANEDAKDATADTILRRLDAIKRPKMRAIAADPAKRAAYELLHGPQDWAAIEGGARPSREDRDA